MGGSDEVELPGWTVDYGTCTDGSEQGIFPGFKISAL